MKREISQRAVMFCTATMASFAFLTTTADAQIFGGLRQGLFGNRGDDCCCPPIQSQQCCLPGQMGYQGGQGGNWGGGNWGNSYGGSSYGDYGNVGYGTGSVTGNNAGWTGSGQMISGGQIMQSPSMTSGTVYSDGTQYSGNVQGYQNGQNSSTQTNSAPNSQSNQGQTGAQNQQGSQSPNSPQTNYNPNPNYSGNQSSGYAQPQNQPHNAYSVRPDQSQPNTRTETGDWSANPTSADAINKNMTCFLASKFALQNESAAAAASKVMDRLQSSDVKDLAKQISDEHAKLATEFRTIAAAGQPGTSNQSGDQQPQMDASKLGPFTALYEINERADEQQTQQLEKMLSDLSEEEIDMGYVGTLLVCHRSMLAELRAAQENVNDSEFKSKLDSAIEMLQQHLEKTEQVYEDLTS